jgi:hypothetical protein
MYRNNKFAQKLITCSLLMGAAALNVWGQGTAAYLEKGNVEVGAFGGFAAGVGRTAAGVGGNVAVAASKVIMPYFEVTYFPDLLNRSVDSSFPLNITLPNGQRLTNATGSGTLKTSFTDYHAGVHLRIPTRSRVIPYGAFGVGALRRAEADVTYTFNVPGVQLQPVTDRFQSESQLAVNFGGGVRVYASENFGVRVEMKGYKPTKDIIAGTSDPFFKLTFGVFYYFK